MWLCGGMSTQLDDQALENGVLSSAHLWSTRPGSQNSLIVAWSAARNACSKRVMISMLPDKASPFFPLALACSVVS
jgi:hypothetical protein